MFPDVEHIHIGAAPNRQPDAAHEPEEIPFLISLIPERLGSDKRGDLVFVYPDGAFGKQPVSVAKVIVAVHPPEFEPVAVGYQDLGLLKCPTSPRIESDLILGPALASLGRFRVFKHRSEYKRVLLVRIVFVEKVENGPKTP